MEGQRVSVQSDIGSAATFVLSPGAVVTTHQEQGSFVGTYFVLRIEQGSPNDVIEVKFRSLKDAHRDYERLVRILAAMERPDGTEQLESFSSVERPPLSKDSDRAEAGGNGDPNVGVPLTLAEIVMVQNALSRDERVHGDHPSRTEILRRLSRAAEVLDDS